MSSEPSFVHVKCTIKFRSANVLPKVERETEFLVLTRGFTWCIAKFYPSLNRWTLIDRNAWGHKPTVPVMYWAELPSIRELQNVSET